MGRYPSLLDPATIANPYPVYHELRLQDPVYWDEELQAWLLTRYNDVEALLHDARFSANRVDSIRTLQFPEVPETAKTTLKERLLQWVLFLDPPAHARLRNLMNKAFTPRVVEGLRPHIQQIVDELLAQADEAGPFDVIRDFAYPLPVIVIGEMLGIRREDRGLIKRWSDDLALVLGTAESDPSLVMRGAQSMLEFQRYLIEVVEDRRKNPQDDLMSALVRAEDHGKLLSRDELVANCALLLSAGHETTTNLIGNGVLALLNHPQERERLKANPSLMKSGIEELLRFDSPVQATSRNAKEDMETDGRTIRKGQHVLFVLGAANRDPMKFPNPDVLDLGRVDNHHGSFAFGPHYCLGAPLARLEGQIAIASLLNRAPELQLATDRVEWRNNFVLRGLKSLPVTFSKQKTEAVA